MIEYGSHVAFLSEGSIRFGYIAAIIQRTNREGEKTEYVVTTDTAPDIIITDEEWIGDLTDSWRKGDALAALARKSPAYQWSEIWAKQARNPPTPAPVEAQPVPLVTDGTTTPKT